MSTMTRRAILRGSTVAAAAAAVSAVPAFATEFASSAGLPSAVAVLLAEWRGIRAEYDAYSHHLDEIRARMPSEFRHGPGFPSPFPAAFPADLQGRYDDWMAANYPADEDD